MLHFASPLRVWLIMVSDVDWLAIAKLGAEGWGKEKRESGR